MPEFNGKRDFRRHCAGRQAFPYMLFLKSGVPRSTISMILNCRVTDVRLSTLYNFCRGFELPIRDFFDYELFDFQFVADNAG